MDDQPPHQPLKLSGFTDEIGPDLADQIATAKTCGLSAIELRGIGGKNVLQFTPDERTRHKKQLADAGLGVISIGSPCGKQPVDKPEAELMDQFKAALDMALFFDAPLIRVFSFYPPGGEGKGPVDPIESRSIDLLAKQADLLAGTAVTMAHENEKGIFGDTGDRCLKLMRGVGSPKLRSAFDFANFVQVGDDPAEQWPKLKPYTAHIHVKDARMDSGKVVKPGAGDGHIGEIVRDAYASGYRGYLSMEPHLRVAGHSTGETGPELFVEAVRALRGVLDAVGVPLEGETR